MDRLAILDELVNKDVDVASGRLWTLEPRTLRFKHGESIAELKVPYHMGGDDELLIERTILSLVALVRERFKPKSVSMEQDGAKLPLDVKPSMPLKDKSYRTDIFLPGSMEKKLAVEILTTTPHMDSSILSIWLGPEGHGRLFIQWISDIFEKALGDEAKHGSEEPTSYLTLLAVLNTIKKKKEQIRDLRIKGLAYEKLDQVVGLTLFTTFRYALKSLLARLKELNAPYYSEKADSVLTSTLVPSSFLSIPSVLLNVSLNPYGINDETLDALSVPIKEINEWGPGSQDLVSSCIKKIKKDSKALEVIKQQYGIMKFREHITEYLMEFDLPGVALHRIFYDLYHEDRLIKNFLNDPKMNESLCKDLDELKKTYAKDPKRVHELDSFKDFLANYKKTSYTGWLSGRKSEVTSGINTVTEAFCAYRLDAHIGGLAGHTRVYLADRRGEFDQKVLIDEYNKGRLYRFASDNRPILKTLELEREGQLFVDMKGFTKKTLKVKEIAMAEFMKDHFYKPIIEEADKYVMGAGIFKDERGIRLNSLPGDAAIFSGGVANLVALARDIQHVIRRYREELASKLLPIDVEEILEDVHKRYDEKRKELKEKRQVLNRALKKSEKRLESKLMALGEEEHMQEDSYRDELEAAILREMEAGLFISYGVKAETMVVESRRESTAPVMVAIGEKINEAARGTFRNPSVRAKLEMLLERAKRKRKNKDLKYPFDIYIDRINSIRMPPEFDHAIEKLLSNRDPATAQAMAQVLAKEYFDDLKRIISGMPFTSLRLVSSTTDIYNKGQAFSKEALEAYINETKGTRFFFKKLVGVNELSSEIQDTFFFPAEELELIFGVEVTRGAEVIEGFHRSGAMVFKGFENADPTIVYEMLNREGDFFKAVLKDHFHKWKEEAAARPGEELVL